MKTNTILRIINESNQDIKIDLFKTLPLPKGLFIYPDYEFLITIANCTSFKINNLKLIYLGISLELTIRTKKSDTTLVLENGNRYESEILIDGIENYITVTVPANKHFMLEFENLKTT